SVGIAWIGGVQGRADQDAIGCIVGHGTGLKHRIVELSAPGDRGESRPAPARIHERLDRRREAPTRLAADEVPLLDERQDLDAPGGALQILWVRGVAAPLPLIRAIVPPVVIPRTVLRQGV